MAERHRMAGARRIAPDFEKYPAIGALSALLDAGPTSLDELDGAASLLKRIACSGEVNRLLGTTVRQLADQPHHQPEAIGRGSFQILQNADFSLYLQIVRSSEKVEEAVQAAQPVMPGMISTAPGSACFCILDGGAMSVRRYAVEGCRDAAIFNPEASLVPIAEEVLTAASDPYVYRQFDVLDIDPHEPVLLLKLAENNAMAFQWVFDRTTRQPLFVCATLPALSRYETLVDVVVSFAGERIEKTEALAFLESVTSHPLHFIRWKAVQGIAKLSRDRAIDALRILQEDPHPHLRSSAEKALAKVA